MTNLASGADLHAEAAAPAQQFAAWLASQCDALHAQGGVAVIGPPDVGPFAPVAFWPGRQSGAPRLADVAERALAERRVVAALVAPGMQGLALPIEVDGRLHGVIAVELEARAEKELQLALQKLHLGLAWAEAWFRREQRQETQSAEERLMTVLDLLAGVLEEEKFEPACRSLVTELATRLQCDRVSLGVSRGGHARIVALSHSAEIGKRMNLIHAIGTAMDEALDQKAVVRYPPAEGDDIVVTRDHERLSGDHGSGSVLTVPMAGIGRMAGAITLERPRHLPFERAEIELVQSAAAVVARVLELKQLNERPLALRIADAAGGQAKRLFGPRYVKRKLVVLATLAATLFFALATGEYRVTAPATLEGAVRRSLSAPFDGYVATAPARAGDVAKAGAVLATMDDREIRLERAKWAAQHSQYVKQHQEAVANRDRAKAQVLQAQYEQAQAQLALLDEQISRTAIAAPFDGVVVKGDLSQSLGTAVKRGDVLFEVTPLESYRVIVNVDEREIADVQKGQRGTLILASIARESFPFTVANVTSVTTAREGKNFFRVEALMDEAHARLRPGMEGVAKIEAGERSLFWIWTHRMVNWLRLFVWTYLP